jgi:hypothetical protein
MQAFRCPQSTTVLAPIKTPSTAFFSPSASRPSGRGLRNLADHGSGYVLGFFHAAGEELIGLRLQRFTWPREQPVFGESRRIGRLRAHLVANEQQAAGPISAALN